MPQSAHLACFADDLGHVQQGLRWNATLEQAGAAQPRFGLDERDFHSQIGGQKGGGVTARSAAQHDKFRMHDFLD